MSMSSTRPYPAAAYPSSPAPTTASSLNYSQYGSSSFVSPPRAQQPPPSNGYNNGRPEPARNASGSGIGGGLRPPAGPGGNGEKRLESREVARVHWRALREFLASWLEKESPTSRASAREKLTRLTKLQFQELSTDVYDELIRRINVDNASSEGAAPFLPVRDEFHPKRNQARQKLATLPKNRFKDLASDVFHELRRRYPEFDEHQPHDAIYDEVPPAPAPQSQPQPIRPNFSQNPSLNSIRERDLQPQRSNPTPPPISRLASSTSQHQRQRSRNMSGGSSVGDLHGLQSQHRSRPSRDNSQEMLNSGYDDRERGPNLTAATNEVVVPNKSRMREEEIEVPYARESRLMDERRSSSRAESRNSVRDSRASSIPGRPREERSGGGMDMMSPMTDDQEYYDRMSFSSNVTNKSKQPGGGGGGGWDDEREQKIRAEYEFRIAGLERRIVVAEKEREEVGRGVGSGEERRRELLEEVRGLKEGAVKNSALLRSVQHELDLARDVADAARSQNEQSAKAAEEEVGQWRDRCDSLEDELRRLEDERANRPNSASNVDSDQDIAELKAEVHSLVDELNSLSQRNDELMAERERDQQEMGEMEERVQEYKRKYDSVRIELRNLKATSTMFVSKPATDDHLPASADGNIADVNVSAFQSAVDTLLAAARSSTPSGVLPAMKAIVEAITEIGEDVKAFEQHPNLDVDVNRLESLKHESTTRLSSLMQAARNHAMASGLSPVSLIDAAAGHLSANVVEIIKLLKIKRSARPKDLDMRRRGSNLNIKEMVSRSTSANGTHGTEERLRDPPVMIRRPTNEVKPSPIERNGTPDSNRLNGGNGSSHGPSSYNPAPTMRINSFQSASSQARSDSFDLERKASVTSDRAAPRPVVEVRGYGVRDRDRRGSVTSEPTSASSGAPQTAFAGGYDRAEVREAEEDDEGREERGGSEQEWDDLKPYLNTQSSLLVNSIQNLLAAIRTGGQSPALNEHLSEVIAIASSIVAVSTNSLPPHLRLEGDQLLKDLVGNTNRLSEAQELGRGGGVFEKGTRQVIASASFGVAKALKSLMKLGTE